jgi:hypothetical protein
MFFATALIAAFAASAAMASPVKRAGALSINVAAPSGNVTSVDELKLTAEITNTGAEDLKIFKYGTVVDGSLPTKSFVVTKDGEVVPFQGIRVCAMCRFRYISTQTKCSMYSSPSLSMIRLTRTTSSFPLEKLKPSSTTVSPMYHIFIFPI